MQTIGSTPHRENIIKGRFAPSPSGRMHLGNIYTALLSWLSVKSRGGKWLLRIEDLDSQRSRLEYAKMIEDDLLWLGLEWDEGGLEDCGDAGPYSQSKRSDIYAHYLEQLRGLTYPCFCKRADIMATQAPHQSDGRIIYAGTCRPTSFPAEGSSQPHSTRIVVPDETITFTDKIQGAQAVKLSEQCGDFVLQRADGAFAYQLAVVIDDALMGVTEVLRGSDLLLSAAQQIFLYDKLGFPIPEFMHVPLLYSRASGQRLSKRDSSLSMGHLRLTYTPEEVLGCIATLAGLIPKAIPITAHELLTHYSSDAIPHCSSILAPDML